jgi:Mechanosensitive ion channel
VNSLTHIVLSSDITLTTTTLRFARTNEVSTVNNWAIADQRIVNCNRSPNAIVFFEVMLHIRIMEGDNLEKFVNRLKEYVHDNPRIWDSLAFCRHDRIDGDNEQVFFT